MNTNKPRASLKTSVHFADLFRDPHLENVLGDAGTCQPDRQVNPARYFGFLEMPPILLVALLAMLTIALTAANYDAPENNEGIHFFEGTWSEVVKKSKEENKPIFLDVYATWCGPCKMLKRNTFSDKEVGEYFNTHFINVSIDGEGAEGRQLMIKYNLRAYPSLLVIDQNEIAKVIEAGYKSPGKLIDFGKNGLDKLN